MLRIYPLVIAAITAFSLSACAQQPMPYDASMGDRESGTYKQISANYSDIQSLKAENRRLRARVQELESELADMRTLEARVRMLESRRGSVISIDRNPTPEWFCYLDLGFGERGFGNSSNKRSESVYKVLESCNQSDKFGLRCDADDVVCSNE